MIKYCRNTFYHYQLSLLPSTIPLSNSGTLSLTIPSGPGQWDMERIGLPDVWCLTTGGRPDCHGKL
ncbi:MAG: hypothetical protein R2788_12590 [Saprospiraceae bacterium]